MKAFRFTLMLYVPIALWLTALGTAVPRAASQYAQKPTDGAPTFAKDVAPILYKNCTGCHRPGEIAPMSLLTYEDARPHAKAIRDEVSEGHMPPWHADAPHGTFLNERWLSAEDKETLIKWATDGAPKGDPKDLPPAPSYPEGWSIGKPDVIFEMQDEHKVPAEGVIEHGISTSRPISPSRSGFRRLN
jgi:mono/diheme cytochrome c family protein